MNQSLFIIFSGLFSVAYGISEPADFAADGVGQYFADAVNMRQYRLKLEGHTRVGETLTAKAEGIIGTPYIAYQWFANGAAIDGATDSRYTLTTNESGKQISAGAVYTDNNGAKHRLISELSAAVVPSAPPSFPGDMSPSANQPTLSLSGPKAVRAGQSAVYYISLDKTANEDISVDIDLRYGTMAHDDVKIHDDIRRVIIPHGESRAVFSVDTRENGQIGNQQYYEVGISYPLLGSVIARTRPTDTADEPLPDKQSVILPAYCYPLDDDGGFAPYWREIQQIGGGQIPFVIINPDSGAGKTIDPAYSRLLTANKAAGIGNIGYIRTIYQSRPIDEVKAEIIRYIDWYGRENLAGFFFDEIGTQRNQQIVYMAELYNYVKQLDSDKIVLANPGAAISDAIAPYADIFVTSEVSAQEYIDHFNPPDSAFERTPDNAGHLMHIVYAADSTQYSDIIRLTRRRHAAWLYITDDLQAHPDYNPYDALPRHFNTLLREINASGKPAMPVGDVKPSPDAANLGVPHLMRTEILMPEITPLAGTDRRSLHTDLTHSDQQPTKQGRAL